LRLRWDCCTPSPQKEKPQTDFGLRTGWVLQQQRMETRHWKRGWQMQQQQMDRSRTGWLMQQQQMDRLSKGREYQLHLWRLTRGW
jgi:hypothetical protein